MLAFTADHGRRVIEETYPPLDTPAALANVGNEKHVPLAVEVRQLGWAMLGLVILQGVLGGMTVLLPCGVAQAMMAAALATWPVVSIIRHHRLIATESATSGARPRLP